VHFVAELSSWSVVPAAQAVQDVVVSVNDPAAHTVQASVAVEDAEPSTLKVPERQPVHTGCAVLDPIASVYVPATQKVCAVQVSMTVDDTDLESVKVPERQAVQMGSAMVEPTVSVYFPATQFVCGVQLSVTVEDIEPPTLNVPCTQAVH